MLTILTGSFNLKERRTNSAYRSYCLDNAIVHLLSRLTCFNHKDIFYPCLIVGANLKEYADERRLISNICVTLRCLRVLRPVNTDFCCPVITGAHKVLFGVTDKGKIIGQELSDKTKRDIAEAIRRIEPFATIEVSYIAVPDTTKSIISLNVEEQRYMRPFAYKGRAYQRIESVTSVMPQDIYNQLLMQRGGKYTWEAMVNPDLQLSDLNEQTIMGTVRGGIRSGRLPETTIRENLPTIVGIAIYDDRVEIENSGTFPPDMTIDKLLGGHNSEPQNLIIANVLYKSEVLESWGRGISLMINECRRVGIPDPEFHTDGSVVWVVFHYTRSTVGQHPTVTPQLPHSTPTGRKSIGCNRWKPFLSKRDYGTDRIER